ncbi:MAG TPA: DUF262 domain-containing protein [Candidatus Nanopelagicales bacterium]|nr:DUF262 domain-containing protein [Candidatus Nanopelagicales bacterium]
MASLAFFGEPRIPRLSKLLEEIRAGEIRVPRFQRPFVWTDEQRLALMDSIYNGYPIGAILVWRTQKHRLITHDHLGPVRLPPESGEDTTRQYLLDGHQRLTTLFAALGPGLYGRGDERPAWTPDDDDKEERERWPIYFDLQFDRDDPSDKKSSNKRPFRLARSRETPPPTWLPLDILFDSYALREFEELLKKRGYDRKLVNRVQAVADTFRDYTIPVMPIATEDLQQVTTSFKRVNSGGTSMSEVHMINALTHGPGFDFLSLLEELAAELKPVGWEGFDSQMILHICKARLGVPLYDEDAEVLAGKLKADAGILSRVREDILKVANVLNRIAGVRGPFSLPYSYQAVLLADALQRVDSPSGELLDRLRVWFWSTTLTEYFRGISNALFGRARRHLHDLVRGAATPHPPDMSGTVDPMGRFDFRAARSRAIALLLAELGPMDPCDRRDDPCDLVAQYGSDALSKLFLERELPEAEHPMVNGPENRFLVHPKSASALRDFKQGPGLLFRLDTFASHALDPQAADALRRGEWGKALRLRREAIEKLERARAEACDLTYRPNA